MRLMYVFDPREAAGYAVRVPELLARLITRVCGHLDYAPHAEGLCLGACCAD